MARWLTALLQSLGPDATVLITAVALDLAAGDPVYAWHPVRLMGKGLTIIEDLLRRAGLNGYAGGALLFVLLGGISLMVVAALVAVVSELSAAAAWFLNVFLVYTLLALGDLLRHVWRIESAARTGDLAAARSAVSALAGRDTDRLDAGGCRRAAVESLSENLTDGFVSPVFWYVLLGVPGLVLFKVASTMDSMVGYKTPRYFRFGWCGARVDDAMNYVPARLTWLLVVAIAGVLPSYSGRKAWRIGLTQHAVLLGPNSGWSEAATAGALERRLVGPIWLNGVEVTDLWIGESDDPPLASAADTTRAVVLAIVAGVATTLIACGLLALAVYVD